MTKIMWLYELLYSPFPMLILEIYVISISCIFKRSLILKDSNLKLRKNIKWGVFNCNINSIKFHFCYKSNAKGTIFLNVDDWITT